MVVVQLIHCPEKPLHIQSIKKCVYLAKHGDIAGRLAGNVVMSGNVMLNGRKMRLHYGLVVSVFLFSVRYPTHTRMYGNNRDRSNPSLLRGDVRKY